MLYLPEQPTTPALPEQMELQGHARCVLQLRQAQFHLLLLQQRGPHGLFAAFRGLQQLSKHRRQKEGKNGLILSSTRTLSP